MGLDPIAPRPRLAAPARCASNERGAGFVAVLIALLIAAALYFGYFKMQGATAERTGGIAAIDASRAVACRTNRQNIERDISFWSVNHPDETPTFEALARDGLHIPSCPDGGHCSLVGQHVACSRHQ